MRRAAYVGCLVVAAGIAAIVYVMRRHVFDGLLNVILFFAACGGIVGGIALIVSVRDTLRRRRLVDGGDLKTAKRVERGKGLPVDDLAKRLGTTADALRAAACSYREVHIPKRRGGTQHAAGDGDVDVVLDAAALGRRGLEGGGHDARSVHLEGKVDQRAPHDVMPGEGACGRARGYAWSEG